MRPPTASPARTALLAAHFERNDVIIACETVHQILFLKGSRPMMFELLLD
jgi:hypothetical protein